MNAKAAAKDKRIPLGSRFSGLVRKLAKPPTDRTISYLSMLVAMAALVTSQIRPLYEYFDRPSLSLAHDGVIQVAPSGGVLQLGDTVHFINNGRAAATVSRYELVL